LNGSYSLCKQQQPNIKAAFSKFCEVSPRCIVTAGACGTHSAWACITHKFVQLLLMEAKLENGVK
jgi:hypothetical protein